MWIIINIFGAIISLFGTILNCIRDNFKLAITFTLCFCLNVICLLSNLHSYEQIDVSKTNVKDVYEVKNDLKTVYKDSIQIDTIKVFK